MKKRHLVFINLAFFGLMLFSASTVYEFMTGNSLFSSVASIFTTQQKTTTITTEKCQEKAPLKTLHGASLSSLRTLSVYQEACHSFVTNSLMVFMSMPKTPTEGIAYAKQDAKILKEFATFGVRPIVIAEPSDKQGTLLDFAQFANGTYSSAVSEYFAQLKQEGLTDKMLGVWNPFPEANLPYWKNNKPELFGPAVTKYIKAAQQHFPNITTSVLLNSATYEMTDVDWESGDYNSLLPYVKGIPQGLIDYAGIQGFPWISRQGGNGVIFNAAEFLNPPLLTEMADALGTKKLWFNTGTFSSKYTLDPDKIRSVNPSQRKEILLTVQAQAQLLQQQGYSVAVNIFAQDKSEETEETNWSYWQRNQPFNSLHTSAFTDFVRNTSKDKIELWLFDI
ncbi:MAG TPA: hypothetical protein VFZ48_02670 [Candidatus Saccharimonadales bacterium]